MAELVDPIDRTLMDPSIAPAEDWYRHVNGGWLAANPVPAEYPRWGAFDQLNEQNQVRLHGLLEAAAAREAEPGTPIQMVGDYFAAGMDEAAIEATGIEPIRPLLDRIEAATTPTDILAVVGELQRVAGGSAPLALGRARLRGLERLPRLPRRGRPRAPRARVLPGRGRALGHAARRLPGARRGPAAQPGRRARGRGRERRPDPRLRAATGGGDAHPRAAARPAAHAPTGSWSTTSTASCRATGWPPTRAASARPRPA